MLVIVDTQRIETLIAKNGKILITEEYLKILIETANHKLKKSRKRIEQLRLAIESKII